MEQTLLVRAFALILLCVHSSRAQNSTLRCDRPAPQDQSQSPQFLCDVDITVVLNPDCSVSVTERYLFPYITGRDAFRLIPLTEGQQNARNVMAMRNNRTVFNSIRLESERGRNEARVNLPTVQRRQPVLFTVQYILDPGVTRFTTECSESAAQSANESVNVIRWRTGSWDQTFDKMRAFITLNNNASFSVASAPDGQVLASSRENSTSITWKDVSTEGASIDVLVAERGTDVCSQELRCFSGASSTSAWIITIAVIWSVFILWVCCKCACGRGGGGRGGFSGGGGGFGGGGGG